MREAGFGGSGISEGGGFAGSTVTAGDSGMPSSGGGPAGACAIYASPTGAGSACSAGSPCSLEGARDRARVLSPTMTSDLTICLAGGTYALTRTFELTESADVHDSGKGGFDIVYRALDGDAPIISGGRVVADFKQIGQGAKIWKSHVGAGVHARQLFVNGQRAVRARGETDPAGFEIASHGFTAPDAGLSALGNPSAVEVVGFRAWQSVRCPVESIQNVSVRLADPCWTHSLGGLDRVKWLENAYEFLDEPGEFYLDEAQGDLFYIPRAQEDLATATVVLPLLEGLMHGEGMADRPLQHLVFRGITFTHGTWLRPSSNEGYPIIQAGFMDAGLVSDEAANNALKTPSSVSFSDVAWLRFERNNFLQLGAGGLNIEHGSHSNIVEGNVFQDISSTGITIGSVDDFAAPEARVMRDNRVANNYVNHTGAEYFDSVGIFVGYTQKTILDHNYILDVPYSGISLGWGWDIYPSTVAKDNSITNNRIEEFMSTLWDGGGIYTLGPQPGSLVAGNYLRNSQHDQGLYPDEGSRYFTLEGNVVDNIAVNWLFMWTRSVEDNQVRNNFTNMAAMRNDGTNNTLTNNLVVAEQNWPEAAKRIIDSAGLEPAFRDIVRKGLPQ